MTINRYKPHILVLPEDRANSEIANGFLVNISKFSDRPIQILRCAGGWRAVVEKFTNNFLPTMHQYTNRKFVLLIDFDGDEGRLEFVKQTIPNDLEDRVFVLGVLSEPEQLKTALGKSFEEIGEALASDCSDNTNELWGHNLLRHNQTELARMTSTVKPFLFD